MNYSWNTRIKLKEKLDKLPYVILKMNKEDDPWYGKWCYFNRNYEVITNVLSFNTVKLEELSKVIIAEDNIGYYFYDDSLSPWANLQNKKRYLELLKKFDW